MKGKPPMTTKTFALIFLITSTLIGFNAWAAQRDADGMKCYANPAPECLK